MNEYTTLKTKMLDALYFNKEINLARQSLLLRHFGWKQPLSCQLHRCSIWFNHTLRAACSPLTQTHSNTCMEEERGRVASRAALSICPSVTRRELGAASNWAQLQRRTAVLMSRFHFYGSCFPTVVPKHLGVISLYTSRCVHLQIMCIKSNWIKTFILFSVINTKQVLEKRFIWSQVIEKKKALKNVIFVLGAHTALTEHLFFFMFK